MTVSNTPVRFPAIRPFPGILIVYSKLYKIVVLSFDFLPLLPIYLPYSSPYPFVETFNMAFHICDRIITSQPTVYLFSRLSINSTDLACFRLVSSRILSLNFLILLPCGRIPAFFPVLYIEKPRNFSRSGEPTDFSFC